ncbi:hypothetical protein L204_105992 [Cryptococcus depauperatus]|nr:rhomboid family membrane protein [Cryptococcus depauperatus CBS 7855]
MPYLQQSSNENSATLPKPLEEYRPDGLLGVHGAMNDCKTGGSRPYGAYREERHEAEQDMGLLNPRSGDYAYDSPYEHDSEEPYRDHQVTASPSLGPWDSASQRSLPHHSPATFPLPQPALVPLDGESGQHITKKSSNGGLSYIDENGEYYRSDKPRPASTIPDGYNKSYEDRMEMGNVQPVSSYDDNPNAKYSPCQDSYPLQPEFSFGNVTKPSNLYTLLLFPTGLDRLLAIFNVKTGAYPVEQAIERKKRGLGGQRYPIAAWVLTVAMSVIMVFELVRNYKATGSPIATKPTFNYMIGPSAEVLINIGARFPPCMKSVAELPPSFSLACLNDTSNPPTTSCTIEKICGHGGFNGEVPDQWWRFILPIFLHVGIIHLILNMLVQITAAAQVEREMGTVPFLITYMMGGIYGFVLGGNFSRTGIPSVGASGALFATNACVLVNLLLHWKYEERPKLKAFLLAIEFLIGFAIGYIPNAVDGLAHTGGWAMGILCGIILYPSISETKRHKYIIWGLRVIALILILVAMILTIKNFYTDDPNAACKWCKFLSCIPTNSNSHCTGTGITTSNTSRKRSWDLL